MADGTRGRTWSAVGQARFARDARTATARHLRSSTLARRLCREQLIRAYEVWLQMHGFASLALDVLYGGMGYPPPYSDFDTMADRVLSDEADRLTTASLYVMSPQMCDVVVAAAHTLSMADLQLVDESDLPTPTGCLVLPHPLLVVTPAGELTDHRAIVWSSPRPIIRRGRRGEPQSVPAVCVCTYDDTYGPVRPDSLTHTARLARLHHQPLPPLFYTTTRCLPYRYTPKDPSAVQDMQAAVRHVYGALAASTPDPYYQEKLVVGQYVPGSEIDDPDDTFAFRFLYAFWRLCQQQIGEVDHAPVTHTARLTAERDGSPPDVRVIHLRGRAETRPAAACAVDWKHRWIMDRLHAQGPPVVSHRTPTQDHPAWPVHERTAGQTTDRRRGHPRRHPLTPNLVAAAAHPVPARTPQNRKSVCRRVRQPRRDHRLLWALRGTVELYSVVVADQP